MNDGYTKIKNVLITSSELDELEFRIMVYLISLSKDGVCYPSITTIAESLNISKSTVIRKLQSLKAKQFIMGEKRTIGSGKKTSNVYLINEDFISKRNKKANNQELSDEEQEEFKITEEEQKIIDYDWLDEDL